jgi:DNA-binding NtrC family response regulator
MLRVLIVDDQPHVLDAMELLFEMRGGLQVTRANSPYEAQAAVRAGGVGVVVQDMNFSEGTTSGDEGALLFSELRRIDPELPIILMTAWASVDRAVELVKLGADDYLQKPWNDAQLLKRVQNLMRARQCQVEGGLATPPKTDPLASADLCGLLFESAAMRAVVSLAVKVAGTDLSALVTGPNGAGKEKIAEIVQANSTRRDKPFIRVNVGALPDELFAAEIFGAEAGAFTGARTRRIGRFEAADGGTLFLDEIGNLFMESQAKLLRALQSGEFERLGSNQTQKADVRVIAATNVNMADAIDARRFREDLYYRLAVIELDVPPLGSRPEDVLLLARAFARRSAPAGVEPRFDDACLNALSRYAWPGNVRELENRVQRALLLSEDGRLASEHFGLPTTRAPAPESHPPRASDSAAAQSAAPTERPAPDATESAALPSLERAERQTIEQALAQSDYVVSRAAELLGLTRQALYRRMDRLGVKLGRKLS